jgi:hypothetical protein
MSRPVDRPVMSSGPAETPRNSQGSERIRAGQDGLRPSPIAKRVSASELLRVQADLTDRDRDVLLMVQQHRLLTGGQLQRLFWPGDESAARACRRGLNRLTRWRVIDRLPRKIGGMRAGSDAFVYCVGPVGHRLLALGGFVGKRISAPSERLVAHTIATAEIVVGLREVEREGAVEVIEVQTEPACWRPFIWGFGVRSICKPDLFLRLGAGSAMEDRWFVEVDMGTQNTGVLGPKIQRYSKHYASDTEQQAHGVYPRILWVVPDTQRAEAIHDLAHRVGRKTAHLHAVTTHAAVAEFLGSEARS